MLMLADLVGDPRPIRHKLRSGISSGPGRAPRVRRPVWGRLRKATPVWGVRRPSR
jgi:hypothetical protein